MNCSVKRIVIFVYNVVVATRQIEIDFLFEPKNVIRSESMLFLMAVIRKVHWQDIEFQDIGNFVAQKLSQL